MEKLPAYIDNKRWVAQQYQQWGKKQGVQFTREPANSCANYWLNSLIVNNEGERDAMLKVTNQSSVMTRPAWTPMHKLSMNFDCQRDELGNTEWLFDRLVCVPSSPINRDK